jgi:hypothetical protein
MDFEDVARVAVPADSIPERQMPLAWSPWSRLQSSFSLALTPREPGVFALAEQVLADGENAGPGNRRMLALFQVSAADDVAYALDRLFASPLRERLEAGQCFVRYALIADRARRDAVAAALRNWLTASAEAATGIANSASPNCESKEAQETKRTELTLATAQPAGF